MGHQGLVLAVWNQNASFFLSVGLPIHSTSIVNTCVDQAVTGAENTAANILKKTHLFSQEVVILVATSSLGRVSKEGFGLEMA